MGKKLDKVISSEIKNLQDDMRDEVESRLSELNRAIKSELELNYQRTKINDGEKINDYKKWHNRVFATAKIVACFIASWAVIPVAFFGWLGGLFFDSKEEKIKKAKDKMRQDIDRSIEGSVTENRQPMQDNLQKLLGDLQDEAQGLNAIAIVIKLLAEANEKIVKSLRRVYRGMNELLVIEALNAFNRKDVLIKDVFVIRVPGRCFEIHYCESTEISNQEQDILRQLFSPEDVQFKVYPLKME